MDQRPCSSLSGEIENLSARGQPACGWSSMASRGPVRRSRRDYAPSPVGNRPRIQEQGALTCIAERHW